jgi:hypothetical protein
LPARLELTAVPLPINHPRRAHRARTSPIHAAALQIGHVNDHGSARVEGQIPKAPSGMEAARLIIERMRDDAEASDVMGNPESRTQGEQKQRTGVAPSLAVLVDRELAEQCDR